MPDWGDVESVRRWIREREEEEDQDSPRRVQGPKTREEYEREMAALRAEGEQARGWREPVRAYDRPDVQQALNQSGGRSAELLRLLSMTGEDRGEAAQPGRGGQGTGRATPDVLRGQYEQPATPTADVLRDRESEPIQRWRAPASPYQYQIEEAGLRPGDPIPAYRQWEMQRASGQAPAPDPNGGMVTRVLHDPAQYEAQRQADTAAMERQAAMLPADQRAAGYDVGNWAQDVMGPAWTYYESRRDQRAAENQARIDQGTQSWYDPALQVGGNLVDLGFYVPQKTLTGMDTNPLTDLMVAGTQLANGQEITQPEPDRPRGMTPAQIYAPIGGALNKMFNPFNPNKFDLTLQPGEYSIGEKVGAQALDYIWSEWQKHNALNETLAGLPDEQRREAELSILNATSGADRAWDTLTAIQQKQNVQTLRETANQLAAQGDGTQASLMWQTARELEAKSYADVVDENQNIWAELVEGIFADPTSLILDPIMDAGMAAWRTSRATNKVIKASQASTKALDAAVQDGIRMAGQLEDGVTVPAASNWITQLFGRTAETKAHMEADALWKSATQLFRGVDNAADAKLLLQTWIENPAQLIQGVTGITSKALRETAGVMSDRVRYGYLTVAGDEQLQALPILQAVKEKVLNLPALNAAGGFNALEFLTQLDDAIYKGVRQKYGLAALEELGDGVTKWSIRRLDQPGANGEKWAIDYLNKDGGIVRTSDAMSYDAAKKTTTDIQKALDAGKKTPTVQGALKMIGTVQRGFLSDMWLNLRPSHWIRNAAAATAATMADDLYSLRSVSGILDDLGAKFVGAAPTQRLQETISGANKMAGGQAVQSAAADGQHWSRAIWEKNNPYATLNEAASQVWSGMTHLFGTNIPFGEQAFYLRAFDKGFNRTFGKVWGDVVSQALSPKIEQLGIDPALGKSIMDSVISAGVNGSKQDVAQAARKAVYGAYQPFDPRTLGIPDELFTAQGWKAVQNGIEEWLQMSPDPASRIPEIATWIRQIAGQEKLRYGDVLRNAAPQPGVYEWTKLDDIDEAAEMADSLMQAAARAGVDPKQAQQQAQEIAGRLIDGQQQALDTFMQEAATVQNPAAMNVAFDLLATLHNLKTGARRQVDEFSRLAADAGTPEMWQRKWQETTRIYTQLSTDLEQTIMGAADSLRTVLAGGEAPRQYDWWASLRRYFDYDIEKNAELRGTPLGSTKDNRELWEAAIDANRQYLDASMVQLYDAFRRFPSIDALDVLRSAQKQIDQEGAKVAAWLGGVRNEALAGNVKWDEFFTARNSAWYRGFDNMVLYNEAAKRAIVAQGMADEVPTQLRWADEFAGGEFSLLGPSQKEGYWLARRLDDGTIHQFDTPGRDPKQASPLVPQEVLNDWYTVTNQTERMKPILEEIAQANPLPVRKPTGDLTSETVPTTGETFTDYPDPVTPWTDAELRQATSPDRDVDFGMRSSQRWKQPDAGATPSSISEPKPGPGVEPPIPTGKTRLYHGSAQPGRFDGKAWFSTDKTYAQNYRDNAELQYVDVDTDWLNKQADPDGYGQTPDRGFSFSVELDSSVTGPRRPLFPAAIDPNARLTKPASWESPQRPAPLEPGAQVRHKQTGEVYTVKKLSENGEYYFVTDANGKTKRFKNASIEGLEKPVAWVKPEEQAKVDELARLGKKQLITDHGETLRGRGYTDGQLKRFSPEEIGHAITGTSKAPKPAVETSWMVYEGQEGMAGRAELREFMRQAWDRDVAATLGDHLDLDRLARRFNKGGQIEIVNRSRDMNPKEVEELFQDLMGTTVGGQPINDLGDVERYLQQYVDAGATFTENKAVITEARQFKGMGVTEIVKDTYDEMKRFGMSDADIKELASRSRREVLEWIAAMRGKMPDTDSPYAGMITYESNTPMFRGMAGEAPGFLTDDPQESLENLYQLIRSMWGKRKQPEVGDVAVHMIQSLDDAAERIVAALPQLAQRTPNTLDAGQKRFLLQTLDSLLPTFDNAVAESRRVGESLANTAMLNYQDRRGFDSMLSLVFPYHYFWTRGGATWARRLMTQPKTMNLVYETDRAIRNANQRQDVPQRLEGAVPVAAVQGGTLFAGNPLNWLLPQPINQYVDPEAANNDLERWILRFQQVTPGLMPAMQYALDSYMDAVSPLPNGQKRVETAVRRFVPMYGAASDISQALTGQPLPAGGDQFDPYRTRRALSMMAQEGQFDGAAAQYAQQISVNLENGRDRYAGIPQQAQQAADAAYQAAMQRAGSERALSSVTGLAAGSPMYYYPDAEAEMRQAQQAYGTAGYDPLANPYGSAEQRRDVLEQNPGLPVYWSRNQAPGKLEPAQAAQRSEMWDALDAQVYGPMADAVTKAILANPDITEKELNAIKGQYYDLAGTIKGRYPGLPESDPKPPSGANPQERAIYELEKLLAVPGKPAWPGENASNTQLQQYYAAKAQWEEQRLNVIDQRLNQFAQSVEMNPSSEWQQELAKLVQGRYSSDMIRQYKELKYATDVERAWAEQEALRQETTAANWNAKGAAVAERMGPEGAALWQQYHAAAKGPERDALKQQNPAVREAIMAGYNPTQYDQAITQFGPDAWTNYYSSERPQYPEGADEAALQQYYDALQAWNQAHPYDAEMRFWLNGRANLPTPTTSGQDFAYDFGDDWQEAKAIFGEDIFDVERAANSAQNWAAWRNANPDGYMRLTGYKEWKKVAQEGATPIPEAPGIAYQPGMPRPVGSERRPVGAADWQQGLTEVQPPIKSENFALLEPGAGGAPPGMPPTSGTGFNPQMTQSAQSTGGTLFDPQMAQSAGAQSIAAPANPVMGNGNGALPTTAEGWAMRNAGYAKGAEWGARKAKVYQVFGQETGSLYDQYLSLPSGSQQRKEFKAQHPELRAVQLYTFQPEAYAQVYQVFGQEAIMAWARTPAYQDTPEAKAARSQYLDANPQAFTVGAWLYGRPGADDEDTANDEQFRYNLGADFSTAKEMFGANIWSVVEGYKRNWPKAIKSQYYKDNPSLSPFFDWWYGNLPKTAGATATTRAGYSYGGGGGWGGGGGQWQPRVYPPRIDPRYMDRELEVSAEMLRRWRPADNQIDLSWLRAGDRIGPDQIRAWRAPKG
jgi:hypothetical protein